MKKSWQKRGVEAFYELCKGSPLLVVGDEPFQSPSFKQLRLRSRDHIKVQAVGGPFYLLQELKWFFRPIEPERPFADLFRTFA